jgi:hypothetical protein
MRIVITVPRIPADPAQAAAVLRGIIPDLERAADGIAAEIAPELKAGQYGWTSDPETHAMRLHWAAKDDSVRTPAAGEPTAHLCVAATHKGSVDVPLAALAAAWREDSPLSLGDPDEADLSGCEAGRALAELLETLLPDQFRRADDLVITQATFPGGDEEEPGL